MRQLFEYHPVIAYRFIPGLKARIPHENGGYLVRANNWGFRSDHDFEKEKPAATRRILLFGDSYTAGDGVSNQQRYSDLLEQQLGFEVYNFGLPGTGTDQHYLAYQEYAKGIDHDLLIIAVLVENIRRVTAHYRYFQNDGGEWAIYAKPYFELTGTELVLRNVPPAREPVRITDLSNEEREAVDVGGRFPHIRSILKKIDLQEWAQKVTKYQPLPDYESRENPAWRMMSRILEEWIRSSPKPVILMPLPLYQYVEETSDPASYQARFHEIADATGCRLHDPLPDLLAYPREQRRQFRFARDPHPSPAGHAAVAKSLEPVIVKLLNADGLRGPR